MARSRTYLRDQVPATYDRGVLARIFAQQDRENTRLSFYAATASWNPASVADGDNVTTTITVPGVTANVMASVRVFPPYSLQGLIAGGYVSADDTVTVVLNNNTGGAVDLGAGTWGVIVEVFLIT